MPQDQVLLLILGGLVLANLLLLRSMSLRRRSPRRSSRSEQVDAGPSPADPAERKDHGVAAAAHDAAAIEAFVADISADAAGRARPPSPSELTSWRRQAIAPAVASATPARATDRGEAGDLESSAALVPLRRSDDLEWTHAGLADPAAWDRAIREESARAARFGRPATVVLAGLDHVDDVADRLGRDAADRVVLEVARLLVAKGRAADRIAWLGDATFGVLLLETGESGARYYADRVRTAADGWLESAGLSIRLSLGWASPVAGGSVIAAAAIAMERLHDADRSSLRRRAPLIEKMA
jgi:diguanylate cyclase (GGDEF)-like protein